MESFLCVANVASLLGEPQPSVSIEDFIAGQGSPSAATVGSPFTQNLSSFIPGEVTPGHQGENVSCAVNVRHLLAGAPSSCDNGQFALEKGVLSARSVGSPLEENFTSFCIGEFTLEKNLMSAVSVGNLSPGELSLFYTEECTQEKGLSSAAHVGGPLPVAPYSFYTREFTREKGLTSAVNVGNPSANNLTSLSIR